MILLSYFCSKLFRCLLHEDDDKYTEENENNSSTDWSNDPEEVRPILSNTTVIDPIKMLCCQTLREWRIRIFLKIKKMVHITTCTGGNIVGEENNSWCGEFILYCENTDTKSDVGNFHANPRVHPSNES